MDSRLNGQEADVIQFGRDGSKPDRDQLDTAGQTILQLIHRAAGFAEENSRHALGNGAEAFTSTASGRRFAMQPLLRIAELEAEADTYREKADRAFPQRRRA
jgi:hypothetical protein